MKFLCRLACSSIGKKAFVALAGLLLCGFLVSHLAGNLLLLLGEETFNGYAKTLEENPLLIPAEVVLVGIFLTHVIVSLALKTQNMQARPVGYETPRSKGGRTWGSRTMALSGLLILAFLVVHIRTFKFGDKTDGLFALVMASFASWKYAAFYVAAMAAIGLHLSHGVQSAFQTFGVRHGRYTPLIKAVGFLFALSISVGFAALPVWAYYSARACCQ